MGHGIKLGQVYSNPFVKAFKPQTESPQSVSVQIKEESEDHEVSMANGQLDYIIKSANELKGKLGGEEKEIPGWIQDHISKAHSYLHQANSGYHEYGDDVNESKISQSEIKSIYDKLSKGDVINITFDSSISKNISKRLKVVKGKTVVGNNGVERITLVNVDNPNSVKYYLYNRNNNISLAQGDMGTSVVSVQKESINENRMKLTKILNEQNTSFNKYLLQFVDNYIESNQFPKGSPQYQWALATLLSATLTDANFHQAAKKAKSVFRRAEEPDNSEDFERLLGMKASNLSKKAKWDGHDIIDGFAYVTAMRIGGPAMGNVTALKNESVNPYSISEYGINENDYKFGEVEYTLKNMTPTQIQDIAFAYHQSSFNKLAGKNTDNKIRVARDLGRLLGKNPMDPTEKGKESALLLHLYKEKLISTDEYKEIYKSLSDKLKKMSNMLSRGPKGGSDYSSSSAKAAARADMKKI
jgi:hypothetical protein